MKILHILRSDPGDLVRALVKRMGQEGKAREVALYRGPVDYERLVKDIFESDKVICWW